MKTLAASFLPFLLMFGCASEEHPRVGDPSGSHDEVLGPGYHAIDPVTQAQVRTDAAWKTYWQGNWYYFESEENLRKFRSDPTAYVSEDGRLKRKVTPIDVR